jgi:hypothetical protein
MGGPVDPQSHLLIYFSPEERIPASQPFCSIPTERLLKAWLLILRRRLCCETPDYNILFRWFLGMSLEEASFRPGDGGGSGPDAG